MDEPAAAAAIQWPRTDSARQYIVLRGALAGAAAPATARDIANVLQGAPRGAKIAGMLRVLTALGQARDMGNGRFTA